FIIFFTLFATYITCFINIVNLVQQLWSQPAAKSAPLKNESLLQMLSLLCWLTLLLQITVQTYLLRLQGKKLVDMSHIFALLVTANLSLWIINVSTELNYAAAVAPSIRSTIPSYLSEAAQRVL